MKEEKNTFNVHDVLHELKHFLPAQAPLKDFVHHNTLHAFQNLKFEDGIRSASAMFGYRVTLALNEFRDLYKSGKIKDDVLEKIIIDRKGRENLETWKELVVFENLDTSNTTRIGTLRSKWKKKFDVDLDALVHPLLFRILCSYLDQGISLWDFPVKHRSFLSSLRELEEKSFSSFFRNPRAKGLLLNNICEIETLLKILVDDESLYKQYLFDLQFAHQGWSGIVSTIEDNPATLFDKRIISTHDLIVFELLLEIDALDSAMNTDWAPIGNWLEDKPVALFDPVPPTEVSEVMMIWQEAYEWGYYDTVLNGLIQHPESEQKILPKSFQALFCIDDREGSLRRYLEITDPTCETKSTAGFFGVEFFFKPDKGKFYTKLCPAPVTPKYLIKEISIKSRYQKDLDYTKHTHSFLTEWLISQTVGYWSALKLSFNIAWPTMNSSSANSFSQMSEHSHLTIEHVNGRVLENGLQVGFTIEEMATRVENVLRSIGMIDHFSDIVYVVGHGSSTINNTHYSAYDCGACSGRPGSVNARVFSTMANNPKVRELLKAKGIDIPAATQFVGSLHDTTRDEIIFYDEKSLNNKNQETHSHNKQTFAVALSLNAKERSRRFVSIDTKLPSEKIHDKVKTRSVSLFEPRPELNHATNALCIIGRRDLTRDLFLDRRSFFNSYDYTIDPDGKYLLTILNAAAPVCGGINLEYFFSRVDNQKLGAGTKLPHNVMGLFGVANGIDGDLRPGLPSQMIEVHDPVRLLIIIEHFPDVVLKTLQINKATYEWFINEWINLVVVEPETKKPYKFKNGKFEPYALPYIPLPKTSDMTAIIETNQDNIPVYLITN